MVVCMTNSTNAARVFTNIRTFVINTGSIQWAFRIDNTFWSTMWWCTEVVRLTRADSLTQIIATIAIWSTWWWTAWIFILSRWWRCWYFTALEEWITSEACWTCTCWHMPWHMTHSQCSTNAHTWIDTLESNTWQTIVTIIVHFTFTSTSTFLIISVAFKSFVAVTSSSSVTFATFSICSTWRWIAWRCVWFTTDGCLFWMRGIDEWRKEYVSFDIFKRWQKCFFYREQKKVFFLSRAKKNIRSF